VEISMVKYKFAEEIDYVVLMDIVKIEMLYHNNKQYIATILDMYVKLKQWKLIKDVKANLEHNVES